MKKLCLLIIALAGTFILQAQVTMGNLITGGTVAFQSTEYTESDNNVDIFIFTPNVGYFFMDRLAGGIRANFSKLTEEGSDYSDISGGPFVRYYFLPAAKRTNIFLDGSFLFGREKFENFPSENKTEFGFAAGPAFFLNPHVAMEAMVTWRSLKYEDDGGRYNTFGIAVGFQIHLNLLKGKK